MQTTKTITYSKPINPNDYDKVIVAFSGGKDSTALFLHLLELGVSLDKVELWHHEIDGREGSNLMDWNCTPDYCRKFAAEFKVPIYFSWKEGGFEREMNRDNQLTAPTIFETPSGELMKIGGVAGKKNTRKKFPQVTADLRTRWCSAYLKIDICSSAIRNQSRFNGIKTLLLSGERGEESKARAGYAISEIDRTDNRDGRKARTVQRWRPIKDWSESEVWAILKRYKVVAHPAYYLGFSRCSCQFCIFGNADQFKSAQAISPERFEKLAQYEDKFGTTIKRKEGLRELVEKGEIYDGITEQSKRIANSTEYQGDIITNTWTLPSGAFGKSCGPS